MRWGKRLLQDGHEATTGIEGLGLHHPPASCTSEAPRCPRCILRTSRPSSTLLSYAASLPPESLGGRRTACPVPASLLIGVTDFPRVHGRRGGAKHVIQLLLAGGGRLAVLCGRGDHRRASLEEAWTGGGPVQQHSHSSQNASPYQQAGTRAVMSAKVALLSTFSDLRCGPASCH